MSELENKLLFPPSPFQELAKKNGRSGNARGASLLTQILFPPRSQFTVLALRLFFFSLTPTTIQYTTGSISFSPLASYFGLFSSSPPSSFGLYILQKKDRRAKDKRRLLLHDFDILKRVSRKEGEKKTKPGSKSRTSGFPSSQVFYPLQVLPWLSFYSSLWHC